MAKMTGADHYAVMIYLNQRDILEELEDADRGKLMLALLNYTEYGEEPAFTGGLRMAYVALRRDADRNIRRWEAECRHRSEAGKKSAAVRAAQKNAPEVSCENDEHAEPHAAAPNEAETCSTAPGEAEQCSTASNSAGQCSTAPNSAEQCSTAPNGVEAGSTNSTYTNTNTNPIPNANPYHRDPGSAGVCAEGFERFWSAYPRKVGRQAARRAFQAAVTGALAGGGEAPPSVDTLLKALERQKRSDQWRKEGGRFIPHPAAWLSQGRWEDELPAASPGYQRHGDPISPQMADLIRRSLAEADD